MAHVLDITIDHTKVAADLTDFPILIVPTNAAEWQALYDIATATGGDIRFFKSDGTTELPREIVSFSVSNQTGEIHVKYTGTLSSTVDTVIQVHADGVSSDYAVTDPYGRNAVWSDYVARYHLKVDANDSAGNYNGIATNVTYDLVTGGDFNGSSSKIDIPTVTGVSNVIYLSAWANADSTTGTRNVFLTANSANTRNVDLSVDNNKGRIGWWNGSTYKPAIDNANYGTNTSKMITGIRNAGTLLTYVNAIQVATRTDIDTFDMGLDRWAIGYIRITTSGYFDGKIKWISVRSDVPSANWITTEYNNQNSPATFYEVASVESSIPQSVTANAAASADITINTIFNLAIATVASVTATTNLTKSFLRTIAVTASALAETRTGSVLKKLLDVTASATTTITTQLLQGLRFSATATAGAVMTLQKTFNRTLEVTASAATEMQSIKSFIVNMATSATATVTLQAAKTFYLTMLVTASAVTTTQSTIAKILNVVIQAKTRLGDYFYKRKYPGNDEDNDYKRTY